MGKKTKKEIEQIINNYADRGYNAIKTSHCGILETDNHTMCYGDKAQLLTLFKDIAVNLLKQNVVVDKSQLHLALEIAILEYNLGENTEDDSNENKDDSNEASNILDRLERIIDKLKGMEEE